MPKRAAPDELNDTSARALAAIICQHAADALSGDGKRMEAALLGLANDLPAPLEVSAGILFAITAIAGTAQLTDTEVFTIGVAFEDVAQTDTEEKTTP
jgi:hypothetical protein